MKDVLNWMNCVDRSIKLNSTPCPGPELTRPHAALLQRMEREKYRGKEVYVPIKEEEWNCCAIVFDINRVFTKHLLSNYKVTCSMHGMIVHHILFDIKVMENGHHVLSLYFKNDSDYWLGLCNGASLFKQHPETKVVVLARTGYKYQNWPAHTKIFRVVCENKGWLPLTEQEEKDVEELQRFFEVYVKNDVIFA